MVKATLITLSEEEVRSRLQREAERAWVAPETWDAPVRYDRDGKWPLADFDWIADPDLREGCQTAQRIARAIRIARSDQRLTIRAVAREARMPHNTIVELEAGRRWPTMPVLVRLGRALGLQLELVSTPASGPR